MNLLNYLKALKIAWSDKAQVDDLIAKAKVMEGPKPSWKTGEFWINVVLPTLAGIIGGAAALVTAPAVAPYFVIATTVLALGTYLGRQWLKGQHLVATGSLNLSDPDTIAQITSIVQNVSATVGAVKAAASGNVAPAESLTETLNATPSVTVINQPQK